MSKILTYLSGLGLSLIAIRLTFFLLLEKIWPAELGQSLSAYLLNIRITVLYQIANSIFQGINTAALAYLSSLCSLGLIDLRFAPNNGILWQICVGLFTLLVADFFYYWMHRCQHTFSILWLEHKLHHLEENLNASTASRHHWLEELLRIPFINALLLILFKFDPFPAGIIGIIISAWGTFIHSNLRIRFGALSWLLGGPQLHRIHHSVLNKHHNKNFAAFFPIWDVLFKTYYHPSKNEFPATGIVGEKLSTLKQAIFLPFNLIVKITKITTKITGHVS